MLGVGIHGKTQAQIAALGKIHQWNMQLTSLAWQSTAPHDFLTLRNLSNVSINSALLIFGEAHASFFRRLHHGKNDLVWNASLFQAL